MNRNFLHHVDLGIKTCSVPPLEAPGCSSPASHTLQAITAMHKMSGTILRIKSGEKWQARLLLLMCNMQYSI
jgi:hypothetical protein